MSSETQQLRRLFSLALWQ